MSHHQNIFLGVILCLFPPLHLIYFQCNSKTLNVSSHTFLPTDVRVFCFALAGIQLDVTSPVNEVCFLTASLQSAYKTHFSF